MLALAAGPALRAARAAEPAPATPPGELVETNHYVRTLGTRPIAVVKERRYVEGTGKARLVHTVTETRQRLVVSGHSKVNLSTKKTVTLADGQAVSYKESSYDNRSPREITVTVTPDGGGANVVEFVTSLPGSSEKRTAKVAGPVYFDLDGRALKAAGQLRPGGSMTASVAAVPQAGIARLTAKVIGKSSRAGRDSFVIEVANVGGRGVAWEIICDGEGRTLELEVGGLVTRKVPEAEAKLPVVAARISNALPTRPLKRRPLRLRRMTLMVAVDRDLPRGTIPAAPGQEVARARDGRYVVVLTERRPDGRLAALRLTAAERARFTASTAHIPAEHPALKAAAERVAGAEPEPMIVADRLVRYVSRRLANSSRGASSATALEAFRKRSGDCTEHSALLVALARSRGIPARRVSGLVHAGRSFIFHQWAEVYIDDRWVPCDPSKGLLGLPACYLRLGTGSPDDADYRSRSLVLMTSGRIEVLEAK